ncbi:MAG: DUF6460 domain-containing protein [Mesorhizobium sp.]|nr:DUF6460 domain-containing protein [Mesorhizobium sp.]MCO5160449.1 DUF6460 domain-containing protein [Mesorhizobium sp.]
MSDGVNRILGDSPLRLLVKLAVASFIVGMIMASLGLSPWDILIGVRDFFVRLWNMGFAAIDQFLGYILLGAAVVVPVWFVLRLLSFRRR